MRPDFFKDVPRGTINKFEVYEALLKKWNPRINLVAGPTLEEIWQRHFLDSAQLFEYLSPEDVIIDLGTGAGFPGMVLAILGIKRVILVEKDRRKCSFLKQVALEAEVPIEIRNCAIETLNLDALEIHPTQNYVLTARALASVDKLLELSANLNTSRATYIFLKGKQVLKEIEESSHCKEMTIDLKLSITNPEGAIVTLKSPS